MAVSSGGGDAVKKLSKDKRLKPSTDCDCEMPKVEPSTSELCFHAYKNHIKRLQGGDHSMVSAIRKQKPGQVPSPENEIEAFLNIGAEAERRNELQCQQLKCLIDDLTSQNECLRSENCKNKDLIRTLKKKVSDNDNVMCSLTMEIDDANQEISKNSELKLKIGNLEQQQECLLSENEQLREELQDITWKYNDLEKIHCECPTIEEMKCKDEEIDQLTKCLKDYENQSSSSDNILAAMKDQNCSLEAQVCTLTRQLQNQSQQYRDKSASYQRAVCELEGKVAYLEKALKQAEEELEKNGSSSTMLNLFESTLSKQKCEQDRILQELVAKIDERDKNLQHLSKIHNSKTSVMHQEYAILQKIIEDQANEIDQLTRDLQSTSLEDAESVDLLNEVAQLQYAVYDSIGEPQEDALCVLIRRIKRIRCRIKSRLQRDDARRHELSRQLGILRCQFITLQREIEEIRECNAPNAKEEIRCRVEKEKTLSDTICQANRQKKDLHSKCISLSKALENIDKVNEFVVQLA